MIWDIKNIGDIHHQYQVARSSKTGILEQLYILTSNLTTYSPIICSGYEFGCHSQIFCLPILTCQLNIMLDLNS